MYNIDYSFFDHDSPELWYFIGFVYADGNLYRNEITVELSIKDEDFLKDLIGRFSDHLIYKRGREKKGEIKFYVRWIVSRKKLASIMRDKFGLVERKSLVMEFPEVPEKYLRDFVRGYFDGDGGFNIMRIKRRNLYYEYLRFYIICGSKDFVDDLCRILQDWGCGISLYKVKNKNAWHIQGNKQSTQQFVKSVYYEKCLCMRRKADMYYDKYKIKVV